MLVLGFADSRSPTCFNEVRSRRTVRRCGGIAVPAAPRCENGSDQQRRTTLESGNAEVSGTRARLETVREGIGTVAYARQGRTVKPTRTGLSLVWRVSTPRRKSLLPLGHPSGSRGVEGPRAGTWTAQPSPRRISRWLWPPGPRHRTLPGVRAALPRTRRAARTFEITL
jgi:hypothetical protein